MQSPFFLPSLLASKQRPDQKFRSQRLPCVRHPRTLQRNTKSETIYISASTTKLQSRAPESNRMVSGPQETLALSAASKWRDVGEASWASFTRFIHHFCYKYMEYVLIVSDADYFYPFISAVPMQRSVWGMDVMASMAKDAWLPSLPRLSSLSTMILKHWCDHQIRESCSHLCYLI